MKKFLADAASRDVTFHEVEGGEHELLMGAKWQDLTDRIASWILERSLPPTFTGKIDLDNIYSFG